MAACTDSTNYQRTKQQGWAVPSSLETRLDSNEHILFHPGIPYIESLGGRAGEDAYVLDTTTLLLKPIKSEVWDAQVGKVFGLGEVSARNQFDLHFEKYKSVVLNGTTLKVKGVPFAVTPNHSGNVVAVLSVRGFKRPSWSPLPALSRRDSWFGFVYHQHFSTLQNNHIGKEVFLGLRTTENLNPIWDPADRLIVYSDYLFSETIAVRNDLYKIK